uniref:C2H2-type domain-containing protein n=1 Tax=Cyprinus carpio TaxID=7962 RepID=A0A8C2HEZ1_CYPCA
MGTYFCNTCQKEFSNLMLICHRRIHTKEKPFSCQQCDKRFSSKSNLRHHQKVHWNSSAPSSRLNMGTNFLGMPSGPFL